MAVAAQCGFELHRTQDGYIHLMKWLPETKCMVPPYATHQVRRREVVFFTQSLSLFKSWVWAARC